MVVAAKLDRVDAEELAGGSGRARRRSPSRCPRRAARPAFQRGWCDDDVGGAAGRIASTPASSGTLAKARHSAANLTSARRASVERPPVAADAVVVGDASRRTERQGAAARRRGHVDRVGAARLARSPGRSSPKSSPRPRSPVEPEHRRLLLHLAVAAEHREARPSGDRRRAARAPRPRPSAAELLVVDRVVQVGEHEVLPDEDPELVAEVVEVGRLVGAGAGDADHVHPRVARSCSSAARSRSRSGAMPTRSTGLQTAPRAKTGTPFSCRSRP